MWENTINCVIFLENCYQLKDDPDYGQILRRIRMGQDTEDDRLRINSRVVCADNGVELLVGNTDACYICPTNKEQNIITAGVFMNHILATHPTVDSNELSPNNTLLVEGFFTIRGEIKRYHRLYMMWSLQ